MTGPRTPHGKKQSSKNALKHGIFSKVLLIKGESRAEFDALLKGLHEALQPEGTLEQLLVEKLASLSWRYRRVVIAEGAEICKAVDFYEWDRNLDREGSVEGRLGMAKFAGGLIRHLRTPEMVDKSLDLLEELRGNVERRGFDIERDRNLLTTLCGADYENQSQDSLLKFYAGCVALCEEWEANQQRGETSCSSELEGKKDTARVSPLDCRETFLRKLDSKVRWLRRCRKVYGTVETDRTRLELLSRQVPDAATGDRLLRYEAALERSFDRTLGQLERLQRMRLGQAVLPPVRVELSG